MRCEALFLSRPRIAKCRHRSSQGPPSGL
jgi:hypothetical protein